MKFIKYDNGTYLVRSRTRKGHHIVDIEEITCSCEGFQWYHTCAHIQEAMRQFGMCHVVTTSITVDFSQFI